MPDQQERSTNRPPDREITGAQTHGVIAGFGAVGTEPLASSLIERATYETYRKMLRDPTIALARMAVTAPILASSWSYQSAEGVPDERVEFIREQIDSARELILASMLRAVDFGWAGFEKIFEVRGLELRFKRLKPLLHDQTHILVDRATGRFAGFEQQPQVRVPLEKSFLFTHNQEADDYFGQPRLQNCLQAWERWNQADEAAGRYDRKVAGVIPVVHYPTHPAMVHDRSGNQRPVADVAQDLVSSITAGKGLTVPNEVPLADDRDAMGPERRRWLIELVEDKGSRQPGFIDRLRYLDSLKMRGYLRPERIALEGQHGTLAEAGEHGDLALTDGDLIHQDMVRAINWHLIDQVLAINFGEDARGSVWIEPASLQDARKRMFSQIVHEFSKTPDGREDLRVWLDFDAVLDLLQLPKIEQVIDAQDDDRDDEDEEDPAPLLRRAGS